MDKRQPRLGIPSQGYCFLKAEIAALWTGSVKECSNGIKLKEKQLAKYLWSASLDAVRYVSIGSVIGAHAGPGAIAVAFFRKYAS